MALPTSTLIYLGLYLLTLVVHWAFAAYVAIGTAYLAFKGVFIGADRYRRDVVEETLRDWLPFALSAAITVGVAPLLFVQVLYQRHFYSANLLLSHRWMVMLPVLIIGFYLLYVIKSEPSDRPPGFGRRFVRVAALACFLFTGLTWVENHLLSMRPTQWPAFYAAGRLIYSESGMFLRGLFFAMLAVPVAFNLLAWQERGRLCAAGVMSRLGRLATIALVAAGALGWAYVGRDDVSSVARFELVPGIMLLLSAAAWQWLVRTEPTSGHLLLLSVVQGLLLVSVAVVRETVRAGRVDLASLYGEHEAASEVGGLPVFILFLLLNVVLVIFSIRIGLRAKRVAGPPAAAGGTEPHAS